MEADREPKATRVELKYCERCGGLWLRTAGTSRNYCRGCLTHAQQEMVTRRFVRRPA